jgi:hypothetical protein
VGSEHPIFATLIDAVRPTTIVEVGTWKGASAIHMTKISSSIGINPTIICIDTWLGTIESYTWRETLPNIHIDLLLKNGWPHLYYQFLANVTRLGYHDRIIPLPQTSQIGLRLIRELGIRPELIYIDASHDYHDVKNDLTLAWECVGESGITFGDDYLSWPSVTQAVNEFCLSNNIVILGGPGKFAISKDGNIFELLGQNGWIQPDGSCGALKLCRPTLPK